MSSNKMSSTKFITSWNPNYNTQGVRPPYTNLSEIKSAQNVFSINDTQIPSPYTLYQIQSYREPYRTELLINPYGQIQTKVGTNLGR